MFRFVLACAAFLSVTTARPADLPPTQTVAEDAARIEVMVNRAAAQIEARGREAFPAFRTRGSEWRFKDVYLFAIDMDGQVLLNVAFPEREGSYRLKEKDADGKPFYEDFIAIARSDGSGWVDYMFPKPGQRLPSPKWSYVRAVTVDGKPGLIGAGFYAE